MIVDYSEMFPGPNRDDDLSAHVLLPAADQDRIEAEFLTARGQGQMVCDLSKKRQMEAAENGNGCGTGGGDYLPVGLDLDHQ